MKLRPITVMVALLAVVAMAAVAVAWGRSDSTRLDQPAVLPLALGAVSSASGYSTTVLPDLARLDRVTYVRGPGLADLAGSERAWSLPPAAPDRDAVIRLARSFGIDGQIAEADGQLTVAGSDGRTLQVTRPGGVHWYVNGPPEAAITSTSCAQTNGIVPDTTVPGATTSSGAARGAGSAPVSTTTMTVEPGTASPDRPTAPPECVTTPAPVDVPDGPTAEADARRLLADAGLDLSHVQVSSVVSSYGTMVQVRTELDGVAVDGLETTVSFGGHGVVVSAAGWLGRPVRADAYPLIGVDAAIARLNRGDGELGIRPMAEATGTPGTTGTTPVPPATGVPAEPPTTMSSITTTTATGPTVTAPMTPTTPTVPMPTVVPDPPVVPEPHDTTVTITRATVVLSAVPGTDGSLWLVPAYRLESADGGSWTVLAIDSSYVAPAAPPPTVVSPPGSAVDEPGSTVSAPGSTVGDPGGPVTTCGLCHSALDGVNACCTSAGTSVPVGG